jgi:hypothetical protein
MTAESELMGADRDSGGAHSEAVVANSGQIGERGSSRLADFTALNEENSVESGWREAARNRPDEATPPDC